MRRIIERFLLVLILGSVLGGGLVHAAPSTADVEQALTALSLTNEARIIAAFERGFAQGSIDPAQMLRLLARLVAAEGNKTEKEAILLVISDTLDDHLPVNTLVNKVQEGLARTIPFNVILNGVGGHPRILGIVQRRTLLVAVRDLLYAERIFGVPEEAQAVSPFLPRSRFNRLVSEIADFLADYVEGGGSPLEGYRILANLSCRLHSLAELVRPVIPVEDVELVLERIDPRELTEIVLKALKY